MSTGTGGSILGLFRSFRDTWQLCSQSSEHDIIIIIFFYLVCNFILDTMVVENSKLGGGGHVHLLIMKDTERSEAYSPGKVI